MFKKFIYLFIFFFFSLQSSWAQCAMCRAALASEGETAKAEGVNNGIMYLMVFPYLLVGIVGYAVYRLRKKSQEGKNS